MHFPKARAQEHGKRGFARFGVKAFQTIATGRRLERCEKLGRRASPRGRGIHVEKTYVAVGFEIAEADWGAFASVVTARR